MVTYLAGGSSGFKTSVSVTKMFARVTLFSTVL